jgi:hypothetical protein
MHPMDIEALSMDMADRQLREQAGGAVMKLALGHAKDQGAAAVELLKSAALPQINDPALGTQVDMLA